MLYLGVVLQHASWLCLGDVERGSPFLQRVSSGSKMMKPAGPMTGPRMDLVSHHPLLSAPALGCDSHSLDLTINSSFLGDLPPPISSSSSSWLRRFADAVADHEADTADSALPATTLHWAITSSSCDTELVAPNERLGQQPGSPTQRFSRQPAGSSELSVELQQPHQLPPPPPPPPPPAQPTRQLALHDPAAAVNLQQPPPAPALVLPQVGHVTTANVDGYASGELQALHQLLSQPRPLYLHQHQQQVPPPAAQPQPWLPVLLGLLPEEDLRCLETTLLHTLLQRQPQAMAAAAAAATIVVPHGLTGQPAAPATLPSAPTSPAAAAAAPLGTGGLLASSSITMQQEQPPTQLQQQVATTLSALAATSQRLSQQQWADLVGLLCRLLAAAQQQAPEGAIGGSFLGVRQLLLEGQTSMWAWHPGSRPAPYAVVVPTEWDKRGAHLASCRRRDLSRGSNTLRELLLWVRITGLPDPRQQQQQQQGQAVNDSMLCQLYTWHGQEELRTCKDCGWRARLLGGCVEVDPSTHLPRAITTTTTSSGSPAPKQVAAELDWASSFGRKPIKVTKGAHQGVFRPLAIMVLVDRPRG